MLDTAGDGEERLPVFKPRIHVLTLAVSDLERSFSFYRDGLGLPSPQSTLGAAPPSNNDEPSGVWAYFALDDGLVFGLYSRSDMAKDTGLALESLGGSSVSIGHVVDSCEEVDHLLRRAMEAGADVLGPARERPWHQYSGYFRDPDGHLWEIIYPYPEDRNW